ncbi:MAG TPA: methionyl-tRNA formyltransferase [Actinomycetota bacterium]|nr:methionyl-tRNA formyltransferase [Actinomycetota bacterium]
MRAAFLGNASWSVPSLDALAGSDHEVAVVITRDPRPAGRGGRLRPTAVADAARRLRLVVVETPSAARAEGLEALRAAAPDVLVVVAYGEILPPEVLDLPEVAPVNVHLSLLPALRGADPVRRAILEGLERTGVTTMRMDEGLDTGPILLQEEEPIRPDDDAGSLGERLAGIGGRLLVETLAGLEAGTLKERPQDHGAATMAPKLKPEEEWIDWSRPAREVVRWVRALSPEPGARTRFRDRVLKVLRASTADEDGGAPGSVVEASGDRFVVAGAEGSVALDLVIPEGRQPMSGAAFARGRRPEPGERLG